MWSLEMQWFSPEVAQSLVERLHASGWLVGEADSLSPCVLSFEHSPELGWRPFLSRVGSPEKIVRPPENPAPAALACQPHSEEGPMGKLASRIAAMSGLERREVIRRAQRKRRGIGPCFTRCRTASSGEGGEPRDGPTRRDSLVGSVPVGPDLSC